MRHDPPEYVKLKDTVLICEHCGVGRRAKQSTINDLITQIVAYIDEHRECRKSAEAVRLNANS